MRICEHFITFTGFIFPVSFLSRGTHTTPTLQVGSCSTRQAVGFNLSFVVPKMDPGAHCDIELAVP